MSRPRHHCPGCGTSCKSVPRYPWHFCNDCRKRATSGSGRAVICGNVGASGGFSWRYVDAGEDTAQTCKGLFAKILGRDVYLTEARFGGIVAQPVLSRQKPKSDSLSFADMDIRKD